MRERNKTFHGCFLVLNLQLLTVSGPCLPFLYHRIELQFLAPSQIASTSLEQPPPHRFPECTSPHPRSGGTFLHPIELGSGSPPHTPTRRALSLGGDCNSSPHYSPIPTRPEMHVATTALDAPFELFPALLPGMSLYLIWY